VSLPARTRAHRWLNLFLKDHFQANSGQVAKPGKSKIMGCDIHVVIECERWDSFWSSFGEIDLPRDYDLFSAIAFGDGGITDSLPYPPRGLPSDVSLKTHGLFYMDGQEYKDLMKSHGIEEKIDPEIMEEWERKEYLSTGAVIAPDWHTPSWMNLTEFKASLEQGGITTDKQSPEIRATLSAMEALADAYGIEKVRLIFWFDG